MACRHGACRWSRELSLVWDERFAATCGDWGAVISKVVDQFLACGLLEHGFARIRRDACAHRGRGAHAGAGHRRQPRVNRRRRTRSVVTSTLTGLPLLSRENSSTKPFSD